MDEPMTHRFAIALAAIGIAGSLGACAQATSRARKQTTDSSDSSSSSDSSRRLAAIRHAQVWFATDVPTMDLKSGPQGPGAFAPNETVTCDYLEKKVSGRSPKFTCVRPPKDELKVKYGRDNGEVYAEVAASRLFWALGFVAERMYPVRVVCRGCPSEIKGTEMASIQRKTPGMDIEAAGIVGWAWPELDDVDPAAGGAPKAQRDALKLLAVLVQHTDSKPEQQRLVCMGADTKDAATEPCAMTIMMAHDLGLTFGRANLWNRNGVGSTNLKEWSHAPIWTDTTGCVANLTRSQSGSLDRPIIAENGRKFLADLLVQLSDAQLSDLFEVSRFQRRSTASDEAPDTTSIADWVKTFKQKRAEIVNRVCPG
jgi:hypothetical protein